MSKIDELKAKVLEAQKNADIAALYVLQEDAASLFNEETLNGFFANILDLALENLTNTLESCSVLQMDNTQDYATLRALYEYAMEHYHAGDTKDASALFEVLSGITKDATFKVALNYHQKASSKGILLDEFVNLYADIEKTQVSKTFYISCFTPKAHELLDMKKNASE